jgi:hypothetical protein
VKKKLFATGGDRTDLASGIFAIPAVQTGAVSNSLAALKELVRGFTSRSGARSLPMRLRGEDEARL